MTKKLAAVVQYPIDGFGTDDDLGRRYRIQELLDQALKATSNGSSEDGDMGNGKMNIFIDDITDLSTATKTITEKLYQSGDLDGAVIAVDIYDEENDPDGPAYEVVWPTDYAGSFSIL